MVLLEQKLRRASEGYPVMNKQAIETELRYSVQPALKNIGIRLLSYMYEDGHLLHPSDSAKTGKPGVYVWMTPNRPSYPTHLNRYIHMESRLETSESFARRIHEEADRLRHDMDLDFNARFSQRLSNILSADGLIAELNGEGVPQIRDPQTGNIYSLRNLAQLRTNDDAEVEQAFHYIMGIINSARSTRTVRRAQRVSETRSIQARNSINDLVESLNPLGIARPHSSGEGVMRLQTSRIPIRFMDEEEILKAQLEKLKTDVTPLENLPKRRIKIKKSEE